MLRGKIKGGNCRKCIEQVSPETNHCFRCLIAKLLLNLSFRFAGLSYEKRLLVALTLQRIDSQHWNKTDLRCLCWFAFVLRQVHKSSGKPSEKNIATMDVAVSRSRRLSSAKRLCEALLGVHVVLYSDSPRVDECVLIDLPQLLTLILDPPFVSRVVA